MQKILLVLDNYSELVQLEQMLKKLGFDTLGISSALSLQDQLLGFAPEVVVLSAKGSKVNGLEISPKIKKRKGTPKILMLFPIGYEPKPNELAQAQMDAMVETPVDPIRLLTSLCKLVGADAQAIIDKFTKMQGFGLNGEHGQNSTTASQNASSTPFTVSGARGRGARGTQTERSNLYHQIASQIRLPIQSGFSRDRIAAYVRSIESPSLDVDLDSSRRAFVQALFGKTK